LKQENDAKLAVAQADLDRAAAKRRRQKRRRRTASEAIAAVQRGSADSRHGPRLDREYVGCALRHGQILVTPEAREKLAKVAGIVSGHPGLRLDVEGHTDNVGGDSYNQNLSSNAARQCATT